MMEEFAIQELAADIKKNGQIEPILVIGKEIIDGRNRYLACQLAGVQPQFKQYEGDGGTDLVHLSMSLNLQRRHLSKSQKALVAFKLHPMLEKFAKERQIKAGEEKIGNLKHNQDSRLTEKIQEADEMSLSVHKEIGYSPSVSDREVDSAQKGDEGKKSKSKAAGQSANQAGAIVGVNGRYVSDVKRIAAESPELLKEIEEGRLSVSEAKKKVVQKVRSKPDYVAPHTRPALSITLPASCKLKRSELIKALQQSEQDHPEDLEVFTGIGGKEVRITIVEKAIS
jgi:ParB-like chromosome segregation protein Spo0J